MFFVPTFMPSMNAAATNTSQPKTAVFQWLALQRPMRAAMLFERFRGDMPFSSFAWLTHRASQRQEPANIRLAGLFRCGPHHPEKGEGRLWERRPSEEGGVVLRTKRPTAATARERLRIRPRRLRHHEALRSACRRPWGQDRFRANAEPGGALASSRCGLPHYDRKYVRTAKTRR